MGNRIAVFVLVLTSIMTSIPGQGHELEPSGIGEFNYYNNPGIGFYRARKTFDQFPLAATPLPITAEDFAWSSLGARQGYWRAASGYYYPWCPPVFFVGSSYPEKLLTYRFEAGKLQAAKPSLKQAISDLNEYLLIQQSKQSIDTLGLKHLHLILDAIEIDSAKLDLATDSARHAEEAIRARLDLLYAAVVRELSH